LSDQQPTNFEPVVNLAAVRRLLQGATAHQAAWEYLRTPQKIWRALRDLNPRPAA
jgi:hypothetical protein